jgi:hypothetical protein
VDDGKDDPMNPLHLERLANERVAELRRHAPTSALGGRASTPSAPDPRVPRRGPLHSIARLSVLVRGAVT